MKKIILLLVQAGVLNVLLAQDEKEVLLQDIKVPVAPAFSILDFSPKAIENPGTVKAFAVNIATLAGQAGGIPRNFAFEFAPYWFFKHPDMNVYKYYGIDTVSNGYDVKPNIFYGLRSASLSFGSVFKDSSSAMPLDVNYIGYALRANVINIRDRRILRHLQNSIQNVNTSLQTELDKAVMACGSVFGEDRLKCIGEFIESTKDSAFRANRETFNELLQARPLFSVDVAFASSTAFGNNSIRNSKNYRTGGWMTMAFYKPLVSAKKANEDIRNLINCKNYLNAFLLFRYLSENATTDFETFDKQSLMDIGGRLEFEFNRFSLSVESIRRINNDNKDLNTSRTVGILQYKINDQLFLIGTFGKDFGDVNNVISLLGLNWGFGEKGIYKPFGNSN